MAVDRLRGHERVGDGRLDRRERAAGLPERSSRSPGSQEIFAGFIRRFGQRDATRIARAAIEVHRGMWMGAPITPRRFARSNDEFFARRVLARLDRRAERTRAVQPRTSEALACYALRS